MAVFKTDLQQPFELNLSNNAANLFDSVYPFGDAGGLGTQPLVIPDLLGNHNIDMGYGAIGGLVGDGALELADNGNATINTYGTFNTFDDAFAETTRNSSTLLLVDAVIPLNTHATNPSFLVEVMGFKVTWTNLNTLFIEWRGSTGHSMSFPESDIGLVVGDRLVIAFLVNYTTQTASVAINGVIYGTVQGGDPWSFNNTLAYTVYKYIGRHFSWDNYYGWNSHINLLALGFNLNGREPSDQDLVDLTLDSYSIFQTTKDKQQEYTLSNDGSGDGTLLNTPYILLDQLYILGSTYKIEVRFRSNGAVTIPLLGELDTSSEHLRISSTGDIRFRSLGVDISYTDASLVDSNWHWITILGNPVGTNSEIYIDGSLAYTFNTTRNFRVNSIATYWVVPSMVRLDGQIAYVEISDDSISKYWEFNQTTGDTVIDKINGAVATLNNFPVDSGYVIESGEIVGYQFTATTTATLVLTGAYTGIITYSDSSTLAISGSGNYIVNTGIVANITVTDTVGSFSYDGTTGDTDQIIETINNQHAAITNASTVKWQPIVNNYVYTLGKFVGDYNNIKDFTISESRDIVSLNESHTLLVNKDGWDVTTPLVENFVSFVGYVTSNVNNITIEAVGINKHSGVKDTGMVWKGTGTFGMAYLKDVVIKGLELTNDNTTEFMHEDSLTIYEDCLFYDMSRMQLNGKLIRCKVLNLPVSTGYLGTAVNGGSAIDSVVNMNVGEGGFSGSMAFASSDVVNCVINKLSTGTTYNALYLCTGSNNITSDTGILDLSTGSVDFTGAFVDEANGDYRVNDAWATTNLKGKGWNGSDIVSWAYYVDQGSGDIQIVIQVTANTARLVNVMFPDIPLNTGTSAGTKGLKQLIYPEVPLNIAITGNGSLVEVLNLNKELVHAISGNGFVTTLTSLLTAINTIVSGGGLTTSVVGILKQVLSSISANGNSTSLLALDKLVNSLISDNGDVSSLLSVATAVLLASTGGGTTNQQVQINKALLDLISGNGDVTTIALQLAGVLLSVTGGGSAISLLDIDKLLNVVATENGTVLSLLDIEKLLVTLISASGDTIIIPSVGKINTSVIKGNGITAINLLKTMSITDYLSASGLVATVPTVDKSVLSNATANTVGFLLDLSKGVAIVDLVTGDGNQVSSISIDKGILTVTTGNGDIITFALGDFDDTNIIYITLNTTGIDTTPTITVIAENTIKEFTINAST